MALLLGQAGARDHLKSPALGPLSYRRSVGSLAADDCQSYAGFVTVAIPKSGLRLGILRRRAFTAPTRLCDRRIGPAGLTLTLTAYHRFRSISKLSRCILRRRTDPRVSGLGDIRRAFAARSVAKFAGAEPMINPRRAGP
jgi:hypothetical protein